MKYIGILGFCLLLTGCASPTKDDDGSTENPNEDFRQSYAFRREELA